MSYHLISRTAISTHHPMKKLGCQYPLQIGRSMINVYSIKPSFPSNLPFEYTDTINALLFRNRIIN